jgi:two-component system nitrate/nitrite response regulator NarL
MTSVDSTEGGLPCLASNKMDNMIRILLVDDHQLLSVALSSVLEKTVSEISKRPVEVKAVFTLTDGMGAVASDDPPNLVLLDLNLRESRGTETFKKFQAANVRKLPVAIFTGLDPDDDGALEIFRDCLNLDATGILLKGSDVEAALRGIARIIEGDLFVPPKVMKALAMSAPERPQAKNYHLGLSPREWTVAELIMQGDPNKVIAYKLGIAEGHVRQVATQVYQKLGVRGRLQAALKLNEIQRSGSGT